MNIIFVSHQHGKTRSLTLSNRKILLYVMLFLAVVAAVFFSGYRVAENGDGVEARQAFVQKWHNELSEKRQEIEKIEVNTKEQVQALSIRMAELHARLIRLDALGQYLLSASGIDDSEFDFSSPPAVGGSAENPISESYQAPDFLQSIEALASGIEQREQKLVILNRVLGNKEFESDRYLSGKPIKKGWLSSYFGRRNDPFTGKAAWHHGLDFAAKDGSDIIAVAAGVVTWAGKRSGYGNMVEVNHGGGYVTRYAHAKKVLIKVGDVVDKGQAVALIGSTGRSTGPHVHFEVLRDNKPVNPLQYVKRESK